MRQPRHAGRNFVFFTTKTLRHNVTADSQEAVEEAEDDFNDQ